MNMKNLVVVTPVNDYDDLKHHAEWDRWLPTKLAVYNGDIYVPLNMQPSEITSFLEMIVDCSDLTDRPIESPSQNTQFDLNLDDATFLPLNIYAYLRRFGYQTVEEVAAAKDKELLSVSGIGMVRLKRLRRLIGSYMRNKEEARHEDSNGNG